MGKNKGHNSKKKCKKDPVAFKVTGVRKPRTKAVTTNLKRLNFHNKAKTEAVDAEIDHIQQALVKKPVVSKSKPETESAKMAASEKLSDAADLEQTSKDINMATDDFSKLVS